MIHKQAGTTKDLAEFIIDYKKKKINIIDPKKMSEITDRDLNFSLSPFFSIFLSIILVYSGGFLILFDLPTPRPHIFLLIMSQMIFMLYLIFVLATPIRKKMHKIGQFLFNDYFRTKNYIKIENIKTKVWKLPYDNFKNFKLDYKLYKDYGKYISKIHVKPKDYYKVRWNDKWRQEQDWEVLFYFEKIPKNGFMEIWWI